MDDPVVSRRGVMGGQRCSAGTRVPVDAVFVNLAAGHPLDLILADYPTVVPRSATALRWGLAFLRREALERPDLMPPLERVTNRTAAIFEAAAAATWPGDVTGSTCSSAGEAESRRTRTSSILRFPR